MCGFATVGALCFFSVFPASADGGREGVRIVEPAMNRSGSAMTVSMGIEFPGLKLRSTEAMALIPMVVNGPDTLRLPAVEVYGRTSWYMSLRNDRMPLSGEKPRVALRFEDRLAPETYSQRIPYADWMNGSELIVQRVDYGCLGCQTGRQVSELARYKSVDYRPAFIYKAPVAEAVKTRELSGRAYIDFPVNRTEIHPDYRRNREELAKIIGTIDSVKNDQDISVTSIMIKGYASPEGRYDNNTRLAKERTETLSRYVQQLYHFAPGFIATDYEPEDWAGLREYVETSGALDHRSEILALIDDSALDPDIKEKRIQARYGKDYLFLLHNVFPALRHSDYHIEYTIREFSDPAEIREVLRTAPQKLSLNEIYLAAQGLEPGSDDYNEVFETAVRMFPSEPVASLNAANASMQRGDLVGAARYLDRAGDSPEATYARGVYAALNKDFAKAVELMEKAVRDGLRDDQGILDHVREAAKYAD